MVYFTAFFRTTSLILLLVTISQWFPLPNINIDVFKAIQLEAWISIITVKILSSFVIYAVEWITHPEMPQYS